MKKKSLAEKIFEKVKVGDILDSRSKYHAAPGGREVCEKDEVRKEVIVKNRETGRRTRLGMCSIKSYFVVEAAPAPKQSILDFGSSGSVPCPHCGVALTLSPAKTN